jgi:hypothetical protein
LLGCHGISSAKEGFGRSQPGSALHHSVTALSVKKALMIGFEFTRACPMLKPGDARHTQPIKLQAGTHRGIAPAQGKRLVNGIIAWTRLLPFSCPV